MAQQKQKPSSPSIIETEWYIGFTHPIVDSVWWLKYLKTGFNHCYMYTIMGENILIINMTRGGMIFMTIPLAGEGSAENIHRYLKELYNGNIVVKAKGIVAPAVNLPRGVYAFSCVEMARAVLGVKKRVLTPYQLFKYLIHNRVVIEPF